MKKILILTLAIVMLLATTGVTLADPAYSRGPGARLESEVFTTAAGQDVATKIGTTNRILGYTLSDSTTGWAALYDVATSGGASSTNVFAEAYCAAGTVVSVWFVLPKDISSGLVVGTSATTEVVTVYYE